MNKLESNIQTKKSSTKIDIQLSIQKIAIVLVGILFVTNQALAINIGKQFIHEDMRNIVGLTGNFAKDKRSRKNRHHRRIPG